MKRIILISSLFLLIADELSANSLQTSICKTYFDGDPTTFYFDRTIQSFDSLGRIVYSEQAQDFLAAGNSDWKNSIRYDYEYDSLGRLSVIYTEVDSSNIFRMGNRKTFTYNLLNFVLQEHTEMFSSAAGWSDYYKIDYLYDVNGNLLTRDEYMFSGTWLPENHQEYTYTINNKVNTRFEMNATSAWSGILDTVSYKEFLHLENIAGADSVLYTYQTFNNGLTDTLCETFLYDGQNRVSMYKLISCPGGNCTDSARFLSYGYSGLADSAIVRGYYASGTGSWVADGEYEHSYNSNNQELHFSDVNYGWDGSEYTCTYDSLSRIILKMGSHWPDNFHPGTHTTCNYFYSNDDSLVALCYQPANFCYADSGVVLFSITGGHAPYTIQFSNRTITTVLGGRVYLYASEYMQQPFVYSVTDSIGQTIVDSIYLTIPQMSITSTSAIGDSILCHSGSLLFYSSNPSNYNWWALNSTFLGSTDSVVVDTVGILVLATTVGLINSSCFTTILRDTVFISANPFPAANLGVDTTICQSLTINLTPGLGYSSYFWNDGSTGAYYAASYNGIDTVLQYSVSTIDTNGCQSTDTVQILFDVCSGIEDLNEISIKLWPSPANDLIKIQTSSPGKVLVRNVLGEIILERNIGLHDEISCSSWPDGIYLFEMTMKDVRREVKVVVTHQK